jgi:ATP-dependent Clp protease protease subunit
MIQTTKTTTKMTHKYFKVATSADGEAGELFLYGYIGQEKWWEDDPTESLTDIAVVQAIRELEGKYKRINVRINSPGGSVMHGDPIITALRQSSAEIHTYNDGIAASMAADIWMVGKYRHMATHSKLMIHATSAIAIGTAQDMMDAAAMLEKFDQTSIASMALATGMDEDDIKKQFYDYKDHWLTARDAKNMGIIEKVEDYTVNAPTQAVEGMSFRQLLAFAHRVDFPTETKQDDNVNTTIHDDLTWRFDYLEKRSSLTNKIIKK